MALDERRIDTRRPVDCPCVKPKPINWVPNTFSQIEFGNYIFGTTIPKVILKTPVKARWLAFEFSCFSSSAKVIRYHEVRKFLTLPIKF